MASDTSPLISTTDKAFWHGFINFYEVHLPKTIEGHIVEFGVFKGNSIRWLMQKYPAARIIGVDILPVQPEWPIDGRVQYKQLDQGDDQQISSFFNEIPAPSLIIEDGSHIPSHQSRCLKYGMKKLTPGGIYIVEDIHTSHPRHEYYKAEFNTKHKLLDHLPDLKRVFKENSSQRQTSLSLLLALEHIKRTGKTELTKQVLGVLASGTHFTEADILALNSQIKSIYVYKRATLPTSCYACGSTTFDYHSFKCTCGVDLMNEADSMSILIVKNDGK